MRGGGGNHRRSPNQPNPSVHTCTLTWVVATQLRGFNPGGARSRVLPMHGQLAAARCVSAVQAVAVQYSVCALLAHPPNHPTTHLAIEELQAANHGKHLGGTCRADSSTLNVHATFPATGRTAHCTDLAVQPSLALLKTSSPAQAPQPSPDHPHPPCLPIKKYWGICHHTLMGTMGAPSLEGSMPCMLLFFTTFRRSISTTAGTEGEGQGARQGVAEDGG